MYFYQTIYYRLISANDNLVVVVPKLIVIILLLSTLVKGKIHGSIKYLIVFCAVALLFLGGSNPKLEAAVPDNQLPVVLWHGMGDTCCLPFSLGAITKLLQKHLNGTYIKSLEIGGNIVSDYESGFFIHPDKQIDFVCRELATDANLKNGYNAIGFSQGAQFFRAVAQRCPSPPMKVLISVGGQHQGVFGLPKCPSLKKSTCEYLRKILNRTAYEDWVQRKFVQATYWHDPLREEEYRSKSTFLSDINNELNVNERYAENLNKLTKFVMVKFLNDTIVQPKESQWFEFYQPGQDIDILPLRQSAAYEKTGLYQMDIDNKLQFLAIEGDHLQIKKDWFISNLIPLLLSNKHIT